MITGKGTVGNRGAGRLERVRVIPIPAAAFFFGSGGGKGEPLGMWDLVP